MTTISPENYKKLVTYAAANLCGLAASPGEIYTGLKQCMTADHFEVLRHLFAKMAADE